MFARLKRLTLRPGWPEDAPALAAAIGQEAVARRLSNVPLPYTVADAAHWLARPRGPLDLFVLVLLHEDNATRLIGSVGLHPQGGGVEIGYWYVPSAWGRGYATEAGNAMVQIARQALGVQRLTSGYHHDNPASGAVLRKLGFRETGKRSLVPSLARGHDVETIVVSLG